MSSDLGASRWGFREWGVLGFAVLLLAVSFWEWFGITWGVSDQHGERTEQSTANAWQASTAWSLAVLLGVAAALLWSLRGVATTSRRSRPAALALVVFGIVLTAWQWGILYSIGGTFSNEVEVTSELLSLDDAVKPEEQIGYIPRDNLFSSHLPGYNADVRPGLYIALFLLVLELALMVSAFLPRVPLRRNSAGQDAIDLANQNDLSAKKDFP
ncbi:hypothetical protein [Streptosporangium sp. NBC_01469]|uniref:hypothetical protein n=1 Tax=Streptosporangium sp. NBC_01469 TaxID=2903898 RepID=UPI002E2C6EC7|nr:hypothetical protein [Streptosporangium sp. NBC_01469]